MDWTIDYSPLPVYIRVATSGVATVEDTRAMWDELLASENWSTGTSVLLNSSEVRPAGTEGYHITQEMARYFIERVAEIGESCIAFVRADRDVFSYTSQLQYAIRMRGSSVIIRSFGKEQAAIDWLQTIYREDGKKSDHDSSVEPS
jgi:hypothetical protein